MPFDFSLRATDPSGARLGRIETDHGGFETPMFMPVGTQGTVKGMQPRDLAGAGAEIVLANTYHLHLRPGERLIEEMGGIHRFMSWDGPVLTDSGGYQVFSLADLSRMTEDGVEFRSHVDGSLRFLGPEMVVDTQLAIGSDIMMVFDHCAPWPCDKALAAAAVERTHRWAERSIEHRGPRVMKDGWERVLFGIVQGSVWPDLRERSASRLVDLDFPGYAIGGLSVGEPKEDLYGMTAFTAGLLPPRKPRYLMGVGYPEDLVESVARGIDLFDCVLPTRNARNGTVFTSRGRLNLKNARHAREDGPIDPGCDCMVCRSFSRAYLRHLFMAGEILGPVLATCHSLHFYLHLLEEMREVIRDGRFGPWREEFLRGYHVSGTIPDAHEEER